MSNRYAPCKTAVLLLLPCVIMPSLRADGPKADKKEIDPKLTECTLDVGGQVLKPVYTATPWRLEKRAGGRRLVIDKDTVTAFRESRTEPDWSAKTADGHHLSWLTADEETAYFVGQEIDAKGRFKAYSTPPRVRRLELKTGRWQTDLPTGTSKREGCKADSIIAVLTGEGSVIMLNTLIKEGDDNNDNSTVVAYEVVCFRKGRDKPSWSKSFAMAGERPQPGVFLMAAARPEYATSDIQHLTWLDDTLLVCAEAIQPILCLNPATGTKLWQLDRPWEFERSFMGPSVWQHFISRSGVGLMERNPKELAKARQAFDKEIHGAIVGGPVVVPVANVADVDTRRFFVAVARGPAGSLSGYLSDCILYEFSRWGHTCSP